MISVVPSIPRAPRPSITTHTRLLLALCGIASWVAGGIATFTARHDAGAVALVAVGAVAGFLAVHGQWPTHVSAYGYGLEWEPVLETIDTQIEAAEATESANTVGELKLLRQRLEDLQRTGQVTMHPAEAYDYDVEGALTRLLPGAVITRASMRGRSTPDFVVTVAGQTVFVETKWRRDPSLPYHADTLPLLLSGLGAGAKLLVVINSVSTVNAEEIVRAAIGDRGAVVTWRGPGDDWALQDAMRRLFADDRAPVRAGAEARADRPS